MTDIHSEYLIFTYTYLLISVHIVNIRLYLCLNLVNIKKKFPLGGYYLNI